MSKCKLLSPVIKKIPQETLDEYKDRIYPVYQEMFYVTGVTFLGKRVLPIKLPIRGKYEDSFYHLTSRKWERYSTYEHREFDYARSEKIRWIKDLLENYPCNDTCCEGMYVWKERKRTHVFLENDSFLIVLEDRSNYYNLVTAYVVFNSLEKERLKERYQTYK